MMENFYGLCCMYAGITLRPVCCGHNLGHAVISFRLNFLFSGDVRLLQHASREDQGFP